MNSNFNLHQLSLMDNLDNTKIYDNWAGSYEDYVKSTSRSKDSAKRIINASSRVAKKKVIDVRSKSRDTSEER